jgi:hypothetical protein
MGLSHVVDKATNEHVIHHCSVAMEENDGRPAAAFNVVQYHAIRGEECSSGGIIAFSLRGSAVGQECSASQGKSCNGDDATAALRTGRRRHK